MVEMSSTYALSSGASAKTGRGAVSASLYATLPSIATPKLATPSIATPFPATRERPQFRQRPQPEQHPQPEQRPQLEIVSPRRAPMRVLVVEDDTLVRHACAEIARGLGYTVETADSVPTAKLALKRAVIDLVLLDLKLPGGGGLAVLEELRAAHPCTAAVAMTAFASVNSAVEAMRTGAGDYLAKPFSLEELTAVLERAAERHDAFAETRDLRDRLHTGKASSLLLLGQDPAMEKLVRILAKVALTHHPVLILGESGTGKETVARAIHANGPIAARPFLPVDCGSLLPALLESELFGGAANPRLGSPRAKVGLLATAEGGTVFLDEIGDLTPDLQARLLRAIQDREVRPVGGGDPQPLRARILAATNHDLNAMVESGRFRKDLYYRLNVVNMRIPPLRERTGDIPLLAAGLLDRFSKENGTRYSLSDGALRLLVEYDWPGNVRELEHAMERACSLASGTVLHPADLPVPLQERRYQSRLPAAEFGPLPTDAAETVVTLMELERGAILRALQQLKGDKLLAARLLGIGKTTLYRKLKEYGLGDDVA